MASLTIRLSDELKKKLTTTAEQHGLDMSAYVRTVLENADGDGVLRGDGGIESDVVLRRSDIPKSLLSKLSRIAKGQRRSVSIGQVIIRLLAQRLGVHVP